jgi:hypothetical protein
LLWPQQRFLLLRWDLCARRARIYGKSMAAADTWSWIQFANTMFGVVAGGGLTILGGWFLFIRQQRETQATELRAIEREAAQRALQVTAELRDYASQPIWPQDRLPEGAEERRQLEEWFSGRDALINALVVAIIDLPDELRDRIGEDARAIRLSNEAALMFRMRSVREWRTREAVCRDIINCLRAARRREQLPPRSEELSEMLRFVADRIELQERKDRNTREEYQRLLAAQRAAVANEGPSESAADERP